MPNQAIQVLKVFSEIADLKKRHNLHSTRKLCEILIKFDQNILHNLSQFLAKAPFIFYEFSSDTLMY